jgi:hypothetical protein
MIISKVPELVYKRETCERLPVNDVELQAGWRNYVKAIAYLRNDNFVWELLREFDAGFSGKTEVSPLVMCDAFQRLASESLVSVCWWAGDKDEGIRDVGCGISDLLGRMRCSFRGISKNIDFVMQNGHGFGQWEKVISCDCLEQFLSD